MLNMKDENITIFEFPIYLTWIGFDLPLGKWKHASKYQNNPEYCTPIYMGHIIGLIKMPYSKQQFSLNLISFFLVWFPHAW